MLGPAAIALIHAALDKLFDRAKLRVLGPQSVPKQLAIATRASAALNLPGLFALAATQEGVKPNSETLSRLLGIAEKYIEAQRDTIKAKTVMAVDSFLQEAAAKGIKTDLQTVLGGRLADVWKEATTSMRRIIDTEATHVRNVGTLEGIIQVNLASGISDPVVYWVVSNDQHLCSECRRLHMMPDDVTPRLYYLSEVGHGYHKKGQSNPKVGGLHPHCRCTQVTLMPGYGFDDAGNPAYIAPGHQEIAEQRSLGKSEDLTKMAIADIPAGEKLKENLYDYSHVLTPEHRTAGYSMVVGHHPGHHITSYVKHNGKSVGSVLGDIAGTQLTVDSALETKHQGKGLGKAAYEAVFAHAFHNGVTHVKGFGHSEQAGRVHDALARKHGLQYEPGPSTKMAVPRGHYEYALKSEDDSADDFEPLEKADWHTKRFMDEIGKYGWQFQREGGNHQMYTNVNFTPDRPFALKREHSRTVPMHWLRQYGNQMGLRLTQNGYEPKAGHPYEPHYRKLKP